MKRNRDFLCISLAFSYLCSRKTKHVRIMTAIQLNAELYRAMGEIADNEKLLAKVLAYVKESLTRALKEVEAAKREGRKLQTLDEFIKELRMEEEAV